MKRINADCKDIVAEFALDSVRQCAALRAVSRNWHDTVDTRVQTLVAVEQPCLSPYASTSEADEPRREAEVEPLQLQQADARPMPVALCRLLCRDRFAAISRLVLSCFRLRTAARPLVGFTDGLWRALCVPPRSTPDSPLRVHTVRNVQELSVALLPEDLDRLRLDEAHSLRALTLREVAVFGRPPGHTAAEGGTVDPILGSIPRPDQLQHLHITVGFQIVLATPDVAAKFTGLRTLAVAGTQITRASVVAFLGASRATLTNLDYSQASGVQVGDIVATLPKLERLAVPGDALDTITPYHQSRLTHVTAWNHLRLGRDVFDSPFSNVRVIVLSTDGCCALERRRSLPPVFGRVTQLRLEFAQEEQSGPDMRPFGWLPGGLAAAFPALETLQLVGDEDAPGWYAHPVTIPRATLKTLEVHLDGLGTNSLTSVIEGGLGFLPVLERLALYGSLDVERLTAGGSASLPGSTPAVASFFSNRLNFDDRASLAEAFFDGLPQLQELHAPSVGVGLQGLGKAVRKIHVASVCEAAATHIVKFCRGLADVSTMRLQLNTNACRILAHAASPVGSVTVVVADTDTEDAIAATFPPLDGWRCVRNRWAPAALIARRLSFADLSPH